jgi:low affinity Fe/Cu permease
MPLKKLFADISYTVADNKATFNIDDIEELQSRYIDAQVDAAIRESEEHYAKTGIKHDARKLHKELREQYAKV